MEPVYHAVIDPELRPRYVPRLAVPAVLAILAGLLAVVAVAGPLCAQTVDPVGVDALADLHRLPELRTHTIVRQVSSYDPTGGNDDGFYSVNFLYLDQARKEFVLLEEQGAGCIHRLQMSDLGPFVGTSIRIRVYLDGATTPQIDLPLADVFSGKKAPFPAPLVGATHQLPTGTYGYYSYAPISYRTGVRVALTGLIHFYNITYHVYRRGIGPVPAHGTGRPVQHAAALWAATGVRPTPRPPNEQTTRARITVQPASTGTVIDLAGAGVIDSLELRPAHDFRAVGVDLDKVRLEIRWDNEKTPSVDVPLSLFFLAGSAGAPAKSLMVGCDANDRLYCYFPMPFWSRAEIRIVNRNRVPFRMEAMIDFRQGGTPAYPAASTGYFRCRTRTEARTRPGHDFTALCTGGRGHVVGIVSEMWGRHRLMHETFLEGDERIYVDFERTPSVHGNGTEDFFNGAYYFFNQTFSLPVHGSPFFRKDGSGPRVMAYRLMLGDAMPFQSHIRMGFEVGGVGHLGAAYRAAVYYYHRPEPALVHADRLDLGNVADEKSHGFGGAVTRLNPLLAAYEGDHDDEFIQDTGVNLTPARSCSFRLAIPAANDGLVLRRRLDYLNGGKDDQEVEVEVGGVKLGIWSLRGSYLNHLAFFPGLPPSRGQGQADKRWRDSSFQVPAKLTRGKSSVLVKLTNVGKADWNAFEVQALARVTQPVADTQAPAPPANLKAHAQAHDDVVLTWDPAQDNVGVERYEVWRFPTSHGVLSKVGEAFGTRLVDRHASAAGPSWFYWVRAIDAAGNAGGWSAQALGTPGKVVHYECEEVLPGSPTMGTRATQLDLILFTPLGRLWSGDNQIHYAGLRPGDSIKLPFQVPTTTAYALSVSYTTFNGACSFEVLVDGKKVGVAANQLAITRKTVVFPKRSLTAGAHTLEFRLTTSPGPYTGNQIVVDCFRLTP